MSATRVAENVIPGSPTERLFAAAISMLCSTTFSERFVIANQRVALAREKCMRLGTQLNPYLPSVLSAGKQETLPIRKEIEVIQDGRQRPLGTAGPTYPLQTRSTNPEYARTHLQYRTADWTIIHRSDKKGTQRSLPRRKDDSHSEQRRCPKITRREKMPRHHGGILPRASRRACSQPANFPFLLAALHSTIHI